jgi:hypothetical protein
MTDHPASVNETYWQHMGVAMSFGARMVLGGLACLVHGLFPFLFTTTGSRTIGTLHDRMVRNRHRAPERHAQPVAKGERQGA